MSLVCLDRSLSSTSFLLYLLPSHFDTFFLRSRYAILCCVWLLTSIHLRRVLLSGQLCSANCVCVQVTVQLSLSLTVVTKLFPELQPALVTVYVCFVALTVLLSVPSASSQPSDWGGQRCDGHEREEEENVRWYGEAWEGAHAVPCAHIEPVFKVVKSVSPSCLSAFSG